MRLITIKVARKLDSKREVEREPGHFDIIFHFPLWSFWPVCMVVPFMTPLLTTVESLSLQRVVSSALLLPATTLGNSQKNHSAKFPLFMLLNCLGLRIYICEAAL